MHDAVTLADLAGVAPGRILGDASVAVSDLTHDSRTAGPGVLFVAVRGFTADGHAFVDAAAAAGSPAVCVEDADATGGLPALVVEDTRGALGPLADLIHGHPSRHLRLVGVTGTNGKTTVTHLIESIAEAAGLTHAIVGTIGARIGGDPVAVARTTPEAADFQRLLARMVASSVDVAAVEVSSHALTLGRVAATHFTVGAFTNLSRDHLDFHGDMDAYLKAKASLFEQAASAVVWVDDPAGAVIAGALDIPVTRVGLSDGTDVTASAVEIGFGGSRFVARGRSGSAAITLPLAGRFNVANALVAAACAEALGVSWEAIADGIAAVPPIPGRFEIVPTGGDFTVVVD